MKIDYKLNDRFDIVFFVSVLLLILFGLAAIYSSTANHPNASQNFNKQLVFAIISLVIFFVIYTLPEQAFKNMAVPVYAFSLFLLIVVLIAGKTVYGAKSWLDFGPVGFQPSEFAKIGAILGISYWISYKERDINNIKDIAIAIGIGFLPALLILLEPDTGTSIIFIILTISIVFWSGISLFALFVVLSPLIVTFASLLGTIYFIASLFAVIIALFIFKRDLFNSIAIFMLNLGASFFFEYGFRLLKPHQQKRIETFINPYADPLGAGYNALQAKLAIGSGGIWGKGFMQGNQTQLRFIPEQWTDFIYCVIGEEFGFVGSIIVLLLFLMVFLRLLHFASISKDKFGSLVIIGTLTLYFSHFAINIGMNLGITPVIGIPLPFLSYGGSSLLVNMILAGIVMSIYKNRKLHT
ncbi:rod shape-determining protein RodA [Melioribacter roseus P3M-2]|uniref:Cell wall polymerase n=1 Tax=Melioribacter roseus (strain DSM 23840 / JCM 17771 / VKM B-2668 / P3M-2) TaxID=1191523 RepID=I7A852_MELRP|nr:rod shape-determining protein RodA [Melioribacter roseus]AFN76046.1 rod shape-determining protein RodA [Melioribacter roseus P3M-2]